MPLRVRTCSSSIASRKADRVDAHCVRTKATHRANSQKVRRYSVVRTCSCTLKGMGLCLEGCLVGCAHSKVFRDGTPFKQILISVEKEPRSQAHRTPFGAMRNSRARCRIYLQGNEFIKIGTINVQWMSSGAF